MVLYINRKVRRELRRLAKKRAPKVLFYVPRKEAQMALEAPLMREPVPEPSYEQNAPEPVLEHWAPKILNQDNHDPAKQVNSLKLVTRVIALAQALAEKKFYPYQVEFGTRLVESILNHDGEVVTALMARQMGKCLKKGTLVMLQSGQIVPVENIEVGDVLIGDDNTPRNVLSTVSGVDDLYTVNPIGNYAEPYTVNSEHILTLQKRGRRGAPDTLVDIGVRDYLALSRSEKSRLMGIKAPVDFPETSTLIDPYWFGLWLGDGNSNSTAITTGDKEIVSYIECYAKTLGLTTSSYAEKGNCESVAIVKTEGFKNLLTQKLRLHSVLGRKHIPMQYLANSRRVRLEVLAGLIDSDGYLHSPTNYQISQTNKQLAKEIQHLARSLGFRASITPKHSECQNGGSSDSWVVHIYGKIWEIPVILERKKASPRELRENPLTYGFTLKKEARGEYYGFVIDGNKRFLLGDFTVTHNTECLGSLMAAIAIIFPSLAKKHPDDWRLNITDDKGVYRGYALGIWIGIYAPRLDQSRTMFERTKKALDTDTAKKVLKELGLNFAVRNGNNIRLANGSKILCESASEQSKIEGETHHLLILEECQDIGDTKIRKSLHPMVSATMGTIAKIGTATTKKCDFYTTINHNKRYELDTGQRNHFFFPYTVGQQYNSMYRKFVEKERFRLGEDSDDFRTSYCGEWIFERGMFVTQEQLFHNEVAMTQGFFSKIYDLPLPRSLQFYSIVAGIDWGSSNDSTVVTLMAVNWSDPKESGHAANADGEFSYTYYNKHVIGWLEFIGDNYETQYWEILQYLSRFPQLRKIVTDSNTCGKPIYDRLVATFSGYNVLVEGFDFHSKIKSDGYKSLYGDICAHRLTWPASKISWDQLRLRKFRNQMLDLRKDYDNGLMKVAHPEEKGAHDDYPDSLMLAAWGCNVPAGTNQIDFLEVNPFYR